MTDDEQKRIARKIRATVFKQMHRQLLLELTRTKCDIDYIFRLTEEIKESELIVIAIKDVVDSSKRWLDFLTYQLSTLQEKDVIPEKIVAYHRKQIKQFRKHYAEMDRVNRERGKNEYV